MKPSPVINRVDNVAEAATEVVADLVVADPVVVARVGQAAWVAPEDRAVDLVVRVAWGEFLAASAPTSVTA